MLHLTRKICNASVACNISSPEIHNLRWFSAYDNLLYTLAKSKTRRLSIRRVWNLLKDDGAGLIQLPSWFSTVIPYFLRDNR
jgi:hypothetical protein